MKRTIVHVISAGLLLSAGIRLAAQAPAGIQFVRWVEPAERAFSIEIPKGWSASGGVKWHSPIDPQAFLRVKSPDGKTTAFIGDPEILSRQVPTPAGRMQAGVGEGQVFRTPSGGPAKLERYLTGLQYAQQHGASQLCQAPTWVNASDQPEVSRSMAAAIAPEVRKYNLTATANAGEATFTCGPTLGAVAATTVLVGAGGPIQVWTVYRVAGFSADPLNSMEARLVMEHMMSTLVIDSAWQTALDQRTMKITGAVISMQNAATQSALAASRQQNETLARLNRPNTFSPSRSGTGAGTSSGSSRSSNGNVRLCDAIGRCKTVSDVADSYYMDHSGNVRPGSAGGGPPDNTGVWARLYKE